MDTRRHFPPAFLSASPGLSPADVARVCVVHADHDVQRAAAVLQAKLQRLVEACIPGLISAAIDRVDTDGSLRTLMPVEVAQALAHLATEADGELAAMNEELAAHDRVRRSHVARQRPLREAVSTRWTEADAERAHLRRRAEEMGRIVHGSATHRYEQFIALGLSNEQIAALGVEQQAMDRAGAIASMREQIAVLDVALVKFQAFHEDPHHDPVHLAGLEGFDELIAAQNAAMAGDQ